MKVEGWHWKEWWAELTGTAVLLFLIVTARFWAIRVWGPPVSQTPVHWAVLWIYSAGSAAAAVLVSTSAARHGRALPRPGHRVPHAVRVP